MVAGGIYAIAAALIIYESTWNRACQRYFRTFGDVAFSQFWIWPTASVRFLDLNSKSLVEEIRSAALPYDLPEGFPIPARGSVKDTLMVLKNTSQENPGIGLLRTGSRLIAYWPTSVVIALSLATPWEWKRRIWVLFWSLFLIHFFIAIRLSIYLMKGGFADASKRFVLFNWSEYWFEKLKAVDEVINDDPAVNFVVPIIVWLIVLFGLNATRELLKDCLSMASSIIPRSSRRGRRTK